MPRKKKDSSHAKTARRTPAEVKALYEEAIALLRQRKAEKAEKLWRELCAIDPGSAVFQNNLALCLEQRGKIDEAIESYKRALGINPSSDSHFSLARIYETLRTYDDAIEHYKACIGLAPEDKEAWRRLGFCFYQSGKMEHAILIYLKIFKDWEEARDLKSLSMILRHYRKGVYDDSLREALLLCLNSEGISSDEIFSPWENNILFDPRFLKFKQLVDAADYEVFVSRLKLMASEELWTDPLLLKGVELLRLASIPLESAMTFLRRYFLSEISAGRDVSKKLMPMLAAMTSQCFENEYLWSLTEDESRMMEFLERELCVPAASPANSRPSPLQKLLVYACYRSPRRIKNAENILLSSGEDMHRTICRVQIDEPAQEEDIRKNIETFGTIGNRVSELVRDQYEENPYPRWRFTISVDEDPEVNAEVSLDKGKIDVLIAGCGTGRQIAFAKLRFPEARITAVDLSRSSLSYAIRKARELEYKDVSFMQADILELGALGRTFEAIECTGVLHHMEDPLAGWKVLSDLLKPGGLMLIGLYSDLARQHIVKAREFIARRGFQPTAEGIRACREEIKKYPPNYILSRVTTSSDFFTLSTCRDLIFHVQEHRFTIPKIKAALNDLGLEFLTFDIPNPEIMSAFHKQFPEEKSGSNLDNWEVFENENPRIFAGMYILWCRKKGPPGQSGPA